MSVGFEWLIDVEDCNAAALRDVGVLQKIFAQVVDDLKLKTLGAPLWHKFGGEGGVTGLIMLTESHLACHTYPEFRTATFNLYCCTSRPEWNWEANLKKLLGAKTVRVVRIERGVQESPVRSPQSAVRIRKTKIKDQRPKTKDQKLKSQSAGGNR